MLITIDTDKLIKALDALAESDLLNNNVRHINNKLKKFKSKVRCERYYDEIRLYSDRHDTTGRCIASGTIPERLVTLKALFDSPEWDKFSIFIIVTV